MSNEILTLKWNSHKSTCLEVLSSLYKNSLMSDATLVCEGELYPVHKIVLSMCSEYFESLLEKVEEKHPFIVLNDVTADELDAILNYMYKGEVDIMQDKLSRLFKVAQSLKIKGLSDAQREMSPPAKRIRIHNASQNVKCDRQSDSVAVAKIEEDGDKIDDKYIHRDVHSPEPQQKKNKIMAEDDDTGSFSIKCEPYDQMDSDTQSTEFANGAFSASYFSNWFRSSSMSFDPAHLGIEPPNLERRAILRASSLRPMEKLYSCDMCNFVTTRSHGLKRHKMTHTGERPYACHLCSFRSIQKYYLKTHLIKEHNWH